MYKFVRSFKKANQPLPQVDNNKNASQIIHTSNDQNSASTNSTHNDLILAKPESYQPTGGTNI